MARGLELVETGALRKLVLAVRQRLELDRPADPLQLLAQLRLRQPGSCRFLWQQAQGGVLLGASPERLLTVRQGQLRSDALAGTAPIGPAADLLPGSVKDRHEHELVVEAITEVLREAGLIRAGRADPGWRATGNCCICTPRSPLSLGDQQPLALAAALHPTPAVAGLPRRQAMAACAALSPSSAAPTPRRSAGSTARAIPNCGWRSAAAPCGSRARAHRRRRTGAAVRRWSGNWPEVALKLGVLQQQLDLPGSDAALRPVRGIGPQHRPCPWPAMASLAGLLVLLSGLLASGRRCGALGRATLYRMIVEADTPAGRRFDLALLIGIVAQRVGWWPWKAIATSPVSIRHAVRAAGVAVLALFSLEYLLRLLCSSRPWRYATQLLRVGGSGRDPAAALPWAILAAPVVADRAGAAAPAGIPDPQAGLLPR